MKTKTLEQFREQLEKMDYETFNDVFSPTSYYNLSLNGSIWSLYSDRVESIFNMPSFFKTEMFRIKDWCLENEEEIMEMVYEKYNDFYEYKWYDDSENEEEDYEWYLDNFMGIEWLSLIYYMFNFDFDMVRWVNKPSDIELDNELISISSGSRVKELYTDEEYNEWYKKQLIKINHYSSSSENGEFSLIMISDRDFYYITELVDEKRDVYYGEWYNILVDEYNGEYNDFIDLLIKYEFYSEYEVDDYDKQVYNQRVRKNKLQKLQLESVGVL